MSHLEHRSGISDFLTSKQDKISAPSFSNYDTRENPSRPMTSKPIDSKPLENAGRSMAQKGTPKKRAEGASKDRKDKTMQLEIENNELKEKENLLQREIKSMQTKLRRIETLISQRHKFGDDESTDILDIQNDLQNECDNLKSQNEAAKEKIRKLTVVERGLASRPSGAPTKTDKYAHVQGKLEQLHTPAMKRYAQEADDMRVAIVINNRKKMEMEHQLAVLRQQNKGILGPADAQRIRLEIQDMMQEQRGLETDMIMLTADQKSRESMFQDSKSYVTEIQQQIRDTATENERVKQENFRLQIKTQQVTDFESELKMIEKERDDIERSIKSIMAEPFLRKNNEKPIAQRIEDLQMRHTEIEKHSKKVLARRKELEEEVTKKKDAFKLLNYQKDTQTIDYNKAKEDFRTIHGNKGPTETDAVQGLIQMDVGKYSNMMTDLVMGEGGGPSWAKLPFLEHDNDRKDIRTEIQFLTQEKADLAGELEKSQNLLRLQSDIQRENDEFYKREIERLQLVDKSASAKLEELARRADEKQRILNETQAKLNKDQARMPSPSKTHKAGAQNFDDLEVQSEFSVASNETEMNSDENIFDFKIEEAEFYHENFSQVPAVSHLKGSDGRQFISLLTVDFFNCPSETTGMAEGYAPNYNTQISFKNKVDKFYLGNLERGCLKLDCYVSKNNAAVHVGHCDIMLKELIQRELAVQDINTKTPKIAGWARLLPVVPDVIDNQGVTMGNSKPIGIVKYKMRLRRPIQEAWRYHREKTEIDNMTRAVALNPKTGTLSAQKKIITIRVVCCKDLQISYAGIKEVAPFFFYQFYTFDDRYSKNGHGLNPTFDDTFSYEVVFDHRAQSYFEKEFLEIIIFDDNAPIAGQALANQPNDDMIGKARIPLKSVGQSMSLHEKFAITAPNTNLRVGDIEVKISVMDIDNLNQQSLKNVQVSALHFNKEWEDDLIMRIAKKLAGLQCDIELLFGIFSQGQRTCTKEDFAYCCLHRLGLKKEITEKEMDLFLQGNEHLRESNYIERDNFKAVFQNAVIRARNDSQNQYALDISMGRYQSQTSIAGGLDRSMTQSQYASVVNDYQTQQLMEIMGSIVKQGLQYDILKVFDGLTDIGVQKLKAVLCDKGMLSDMDAGRVIQHFGQRMDFKKLEQCFLDAKRYNLSISPIVKKVRASVDSHMRLCIKWLEGVDYNKDGHLNVDGFLAALLHQELNVKKEELREAFFLSANNKNELAYQDWLESINSQAAQYFSMSVHTVSRDKLLTESVTLTGREMVKDSSGFDTYKKFDINEQKVKSACIKFENYIRSQDLSLGVIFAIIDSNSDKYLKFNEFRQKLLQMEMRLDEEEMISLFKSMDVNNSGSIEYTELIQKFSQLNNQQLLKRISTFIMSGKGNPDFIFDKYSKDVTRGRMSVAEFTIMVKDFVKRVTQPEIQQMFRHFDRGNKEYITRQDFVAAFSTDIKEQTFQIQIEDIIKPLTTKLSKFKVNIGAMFDKVDKDRNYRISAEEFATSLSDSSGGKIKLDEAEIKMMRDYFQNRYQHVEISRAEFQELLSTKFQNKFDEAEAKKSLGSVSQKCYTLKIDLQKHMMESNAEQTEKINLRSFKIGLNNLQCLTLYNIDNLAKYMDTENEGFISLSDFINRVKLANINDDSFKRQTTKSNSKSDTMQSRTSKWSKTKH